MTEASKRLSPLQLAAVMLCMSFSGLAAYRPEGAGLTAAALGELLAAAGGFLLLLPLCLGRGGAAPLGRLRAGLGLGYLAFYLTVMLGDLASTVQYAFPRLYSTPAVIALTAAAGLYCASMGSRACGKTACASVITAAVCVLLIALGAAEHFRAVNIFLGARPIEEVLSGLGAMAARSGELAVFVLLLPESEGRPFKTAAVYSSVRGATGAGLLLFAKGVLGVLADSGQPVFLLSSASKTAVIERFDAALLLVWVLCTVTSCGAVLCAARACLTAFKPDAPAPLYRVGAFSALCAAAAFALFAGGKAAGFDSGAVPVASAALLGMVVVSACFAAMIRRK
ncbi:MAG: hypothetical protein IJ746_03335 [Ruminococcus sp.]|nr:hypothetical protein [Ruminococcus sp.]